MRSHQRQTQARVELLSRLFAAFLVALKLQIRETSAALLKLDKLREKQLRVIAEEKSSLNTHLRLVRDMQTPTFRAVVEEHLADLRFVFRSSLVSAPPVDALRALLATKRRAAVAAYNNRLDWTVPLVDIDSVRSFLRGGHDPVVHFIHDKEKELEREATGMSPLLLLQAVSECDLLAVLRSMRSA